VTINVEYDEVDVTAMGNAVKNSIPGLGSWQIELELNQDYGTSGLDSIIWPLVGADSATAIEVRPNRASSFPKWSGNGRIFAYNPIEGSVGDGASAKITIKPGDGNMLTRATS